MYKLLIILFFTPFLTFGATTGTFNGGVTPTCFQYGVDYPAYTVNGSGSTQQQIQIEFDSGYTPNTGTARYVTSGSLPLSSNVNWSTAYDGVSARPWHAWRYQFYTDGDGFSGWTSTDFVVQDGECTDPEPEAPTVATSSATTGDIVFGVTILIFLISLGLVGFAFNSLNKKKPWK